jgi:hypothetical protein
MLMCAVIGRNLGFPAYDGLQSSLRKAQSFNMRQAWSRVCLPAAKPDKYLASASVSGTFRCHAMNGSRMETQIKAHRRQAVKQHAGGWFACARKLGDGSPPLAARAEQVSADRQSIRAFASRSCRIARARGPRRCRPGDQPSQPRQAGGPGMGAVLEATRLAASSET